MYTGRQADRQTVRYTEKERQQDRRKARNTDRQADRKIRQRGRKEKTNISLYKEYAQQLAGWMAVENEGINNMDWCGVACRGAAWRGLAGLGGA